MTELSWNENGQFVYRVTSNYVLKGGVCMGTKRTCVGDREKGLDLVNEVTHSHLKQSKFSLK